MNISIHPHIPRYNRPRCYHFRMSVCPIPHDYIKKMTKLKKIKELKKNVPKRYNANENYDHMMDLIEEEEQKEQKEQKKVPIIYK